MAAESFELAREFDGEKVLGIDPGAHGALTLLSLGKWRFLDTADMPIRDKGKTVTNNVLDGRGLRALLDVWRPTVIVVESPQPVRGRTEEEPGAGSKAMPASTAFTFGGFVLGVVTACEALGYDTYTVAPQVWKRAAQLGRVGDRSRSDVKAESLALALRLWPDAPLTKKKHENRAEAALIARFGLASQMRFF